MRDTMWGFLMFAGVAWLAISWCVLRLEPVDVVAVAAPMLLFGALCEALRALAGTRTWWLNAGLAALFAATGGVLWLDGGSSFATPVALVGWFLMVRGAVDVAVSTLNRGTDRTWGLLMVLGVVQAVLGFYAASAFARAADPLILLLGALGLVRGVADLVTSLRLRELSSVRHEVLRLSPEGEAGVAGYSAGLTDFEVSPKARHRAGSFHDEVVRTTQDLDSMIAQAGVTGTAAAAHRVPEGLPPAPDSPEGVAAAAGSEEKRR